MLYIEASQPDDPGDKWVEWYLGDKLPKLEHKPFVQLQAEGPELEVILQALQKSRGK